MNTIESRSTCEHSMVQTLERMRVWDAQDKFRLFDIAAGGERVERCWLGNSVAVSLVSAEADRSSLPKLHRLVPFLPAPQDVAVSRKSYRGFSFSTWLLALSFLNVLTERDR